MPHFHIETNDDDSVRQIWRDGVPHLEGAHLEQLYAIVTLYFKVAGANIQNIEQERKTSLRRAYGVQSFVMALTGLEAFTNTYFKLRAGELDNEVMVKRVSQKHGSLTNKIKELLAMTPEVQIEGQVMVLDKLHELSQLRNALVHPQWEPASITLASEVSISITGLVQNFQAAFEDPVFCREAFMWCMLLVARVGRARGNKDVAGFLFHWTGIYGLSEQQILSELQLSEQIVASSQD